MPQEVPDSFRQKSNPLEKLCLVTEIGVEEDLSSLFLSVFGTRPLKIVCTFFLLGDRVSVGKPSEQRKRYILSLFFAGIYVLCHSLHAADQFGDPLPKRGQVRETVLFSILKWRQVSHGQN